jgi:hypothetical protein
MNVHVSRTGSWRPVRYVIRREPATRSELLEHGWTESQIREYAWPMVVHAYAVAADGRERLVPHHVRHSPTAGWSSATTGRALPSLRGAC